MFRRRSAGSRTLSRARPPGVKWTDSPSPRGGNWALVGQRLLLGEIESFSRMAIFELEGTEQHKNFRFLGSMHDESELTHATTFNLGLGLTISGRLSLPKFL